MVETMPQVKLKDCLQKLEIFLSYGLSAEEIRRGFVKEELFEMMMHFHQKPLHSPSPEYSGDAVYGIVKKEPTLQMSPYLAKCFDKLTILIVSGASEARLKADFLKEEMLVMLMYLREKTLFKDVDALIESIQEIEYEEVAHG